MTTEPREHPHDRLLALLPSAHAESCQVVATFLDIRGFSGFSATGESFDSALYLRRVFVEILTKTFHDVDFFKLTGDGLLIVHEISAVATDLPKLVSSVLSRSAELVLNFPTITQNDYMVNFNVPTKLGVGVARGSVTKLVSEGVVLDYTGRCLNLGSRLMDKARPAGVVFSDMFARTLMEDEVSAQFTEDKVCIRGISETQPMAIFISREVVINPVDREPTPGSTTAWGTPITIPLQEVLDLSSYGFFLPRRPLSHEIAGVHIEYPSFDANGKDTGSVKTRDLGGNVEEEPEGPLVRIALSPVLPALRRLPLATKFGPFTMKTNVKFTPFCRPKTQIEKPRTG